MIKEIKRLRKKNKKAPGRTKASGSQENKDNVTIAVPADGASFLGNGNSYWSQAVKDLLYKKITKVNVKAYYPQAEHQGYCVRYEQDGQSGLWVPATWLGE